jgi:ribosomal protein L18E
MIHLLERVHQADQDFGLRRFELIGPAEQTLCVLGAVLDEGKICLDSKRVGRIRVSALQFSTELDELIV